MVYVFLVRALFRGRRWANRRVVLLGAFGILGLAFLLATPYPLWMHAEQVAQALVLAALLYFASRPEVRAHFAKGLPGRDAKRRWRRQRNTASPPAWTIFRVARQPSGRRQTRLRQGQRPGEHASDMDR